MAHKLDTPKYCWRQVLQVCTVVQTLPCRDRGRMQGASSTLMTIQGWRWCSGYTITAGEGPAAMLGSS